MTTDSFQNRRGRRRMRTPISFMVEPKSAWGFTLAFAIVSVTLVTTQVESFRRRMWMNNWIKVLAFISAVVCIIALPAWKAREGFAGLLPENQQENSLPPLNATEKNRKQGQAFPKDEEPYKTAKDAAVSALLSRMSEVREELYVYKDFGLTENHFTQKAKMAGSDYDLVMDMDENFRQNPYKGSSCIRCEQITREGDWGGWLFLNGFLPKGEETARLNDGSTDGQGMDLSGAGALRFYARGEHGGEKVEFFTGGFGYDGTTNQQTAAFPDSTTKKSLGWVKLTPEWQEYVISLDDADLRYVVCGFGFVLNDVMDGNGDHVFYLDEIRFTGNIRSIQEMPVLLRSFDTENQYLINTAFSYDNALAAMALISEGKQKEAKEILDAFVYAVKNDRSRYQKSADAMEQNVDTEKQTETKRVRNAYAAGGISPYPGWESGARLPGWYDSKTRVWYEDRYQVGSNVGNTSYVALALMHYYNAYGGEEYLETICALMDWVIDRCTEGGDGFTGGFDGWETGKPPVVYPFTYKSTEHNIDAFAAFTALYTATGESRYYEAAMSAKRFVQSMYDEDQGLFLIGVLEDGITTNTSVVVLDAQVWSCLALGDSFEPYSAALETVRKMKTSEGGYPFCLENRNAGWWAEGTAYTALMYRILGDKEKYTEAMKVLVDMQLGSGLFPAASVENLSTGLELFDGSPWEYNTDPHIAPAAWFIMAANGFNPYFPVS